MAEQLSPSDSRNGLFPCYFAAVLCKEKQTKGIPGQLDRRYNSMGTIGSIYQMLGKNKERHSKTIDVFRKACNVIELSYGIAYGSVVINATLHSMVQRDTQNVSPLRRGVAKQYGLAN